MNASGIPVLLTSSVIAYDTGVALSDTQERIRLAMESIAQWLKIDASLRLVLCDGSDFDFSNLVKKAFPEAHIECLHFENNQSLVKLHGRGYGEGEIVRYAVDKSRYIAQAECFAKCTSKLWVENYAQCILHWNEHLLCKGVFKSVFSVSRKIQFDYVDTRFYISQKSLYLRYFADAHLNINAQSGYGLEDCFKEIILKYRLQHCMFSDPPVICGVGGGTGKHYRNSLHRRLKERLRYAIVRTNSSFSSFF